MSIQALKGTSVTVTETFSVDGAPTDLDSGVPVIHAFFPDGTELTPQPTASNSWTGRTTGQYRVVLAAQPEVTYLDPITWTGMIGGQQQTLSSRVEWVGGLLFTLDAMRKVRVGNDTPFTDATKFSDAKLQEARTAVLDEFEQILGFSPVLRRTLETHNGNGSRQLSVYKAKPDNLISVTVDGASRATSEFTLSREGILTWVNGWFPCTQPQNVVLEYSHGWGYVRGRGSAMAMAVAAKWLQPSQFSGATTVVTPDGASYNFDAAGQVTQAGTIRHFGVPEIDAWLNRWTEAGLAVA
jgi:hypothetical protein